MSQMKLRIDYESGNSRVGGTLFDDDSACLCHPLLKVDEKQTGSVKGGFGSVLVFGEEMQHFSSAPYKQKECNIIFNPGI